MSTPAPVVPSSVSGTADVPPLGGTLDRTAAAPPEHEALVEVSTGRGWTCRELRAEVDTLARGLLAAGLATGDRVGVPRAPRSATTTSATAPRS